MRLSNRPGPLTLHSSNRGVALVITLSFLLISTAIVVAFLLRSQSDVRASASYSASVQSDLLAAGAMDQVVANFIQEITDPENSNVTATGDFRWFEPIQRNSKFPSMVPDVVTKLSPPSGGLRNTLIKQSIPGKFYSQSASAPDIPASSVTTISSTGKPGDRPVSAARWDLPRLLQNSSADGEAYFSDQDVPNWIYVQENGEAITTPPGKNSPFPIAGRYAYNVYDVGGLVNVNVAGYDSAAANEVGFKGATAFADLTQIPGGLQGNQSKVNELVNWRSPYVSWSNRGDALSPIGGGTYSILDYLRMGAGVGWRKNPSTSGNSGNQFFSRKDLIKYATQNGFADSLPFLTHFSVDADAPSFSPDTEILKLGLRDRGANGLRRASSGEKVLESEEGQTLTTDDQKRINPARSDPKTVMLALEVPGGKTVTAPVLFKRFPLSRLALVQTDPAARQKAGATPELIQRYFGLVRDGNDYTWKYRDIDGEETQIKTLDEVAARNREPNFFELLKAVIQVGSLAQSRHSTMIPLNSLEPRANRVDEHIIRIGAAIIDQADPDSYPTRIRFNYDNATAFGEIYGVEDLPYIYGFRFVGYGKPESQQTHWFLAQPTLWNPHNPRRRNVSTAIPNEFQVSALKPNGPIFVNAHATTNPPAIFIDNQFTPATQLSFKWTPESPAFRQPQGLLSSLYPQGVELSGTPDTYFPLNTAENQVFTPLQPFQNNQAIGFLLGHNDDKKSWMHVSYNGGQAQFLLKYKGGDGNYYAYDKLWFNPSYVSHGVHAEHKTETFSSLFSGRQNPVTTDGPNLRSEAAYLKSDPRSQRFIWPSEMAYFSGPAATHRYRLPEGTTAAPWGGVRASSSPVSGYDETDNRSSSILSNGKGGFTDLWRLTQSSHPAGSGNDWTYREDLGYLTINNKSTSASRGFYYSDQDSVVRRAMAGAAIIPATYLNEPPVPLLTQNAVDSLPTPLQSLPIRNRPATNEEGQNFYQNRPIVLNRPFRSVGELAHTFRDVPWKNLDFTFQESGDTGLLDVFTVYENPSDSEIGTPLVAGKVNLNVAPPPVLSALLHNAAREIPMDSLSATDKLTALTPLTTRLIQYRNPDGSPSEENDGANGPMRSLAELVGRVYGAGDGKFSNHARFVGVRPEQFGDAKDQTRPERMAALVRSLADSGTTRTWNLMIDLIAQSGTGDTFTDFKASSESRWWLFISIDRFTGKILARSVERVVE